MDHFIQYTARGLYISCLLWNVAHSSDFGDFEERHKRLREEVERSHRNFDRNFYVFRVVVPLVMGTLFVVFCIIFCCISYRRRQRFWEMQQQQQQRHVPPALAVAPGPGPVTSGAATYSYPHGNPPVPSAVVPPQPAPYPPQPQPVGAYQWGGPYTGPSSAPSAQPFNATAAPWPCAPPPPPPYSSETKQLL